MEQPDNKKPVKSKPPTREQLEKLAYDQYAARLSEIDFLAAYKDLMEQAFVYTDQIKAAVEVVSNDEVLCNQIANAVVNRFGKLNKERFAEVDRLRPSRR